MANRCRRENLARCRALLGQPPSGALPAKQQQTAFNLNDRCKKHNLQNTPFSWRKIPIDKGASPSSRRASGRRSADSPPVLATIPGMAVQRPLQQIPLGDFFNGLVAAHKSTLLHFISQELIPGSTSVTC
jgi:hypothetical protein